MQDVMEKYEPNNRILIVDDKPDNISSLSKTLENINCEVEAANSGKEALRKALKNNFALILLDVKMPEMDGFETAHLLKGNSKTKNIPIIFLTAISKADKFFIKGLLTGAVDYITKPINDELLILKIQVFLELFNQSEEMKFIKNKLEYLNINLQSEVDKRTEELIKAKEKAEEANHVKTKFFANMSHELRTPLVGILGFSEIIKEEDEVEEFKEYGAMIYASTLRLQRTLNSVLDFSKIDDKTFKFEIDKINVNVLAIEEFNLFKIDAEKKQIDYKLNLERDTFIIKSDSRLLSTIFSHLIDNALKYTNKGFVEVNVGKVLDGNNTFLFFEVRDSGIGIEKSQLNLIWDEFKQVSEGLARNYEGVGLGLSIVKKFVGLLKGNIEAESEYAKGSSFRVKIPVEEVQIEDIKSNDIKEKLDKQLNKLILIVEDDALNALAIRKFLDKNYQVEHAGSPKEAIKMCKKNKYYLVLMDINLKSEMDGIGLMKFLKENNFNYKDIPFVAQTAYAVNKDKMRFLESGFSDFISKPYTRKSLLEIVEKNLS